MVPNGWEGACKTATVWAGVSRDISVAHTREVVVLVVVVLINVVLVVLGDDDDVVGAIVVVVVAVVTTLLTSTRPNTLESPYNESCASHARVPSGIVPNLPTSPT